MKIRCIYLCILTAIVFSGCAINQHNVYYKEYDPNTYEKKINFTKQNRGSGISLFWAEDSLLVAFENLTKSEMKKASKDTNLSEYEKVIGKVHAYNPVTCQPLELSYDNCVELYEAWVNTCKSERREDNTKETTAKVAKECCNMLSLMAAVAGGGDTSRTDVFEQFSNYQGTVYTLLQDKSVNFTCRLGERDNMTSSFVLEYTVSNEPFIMNSGLSPIIKMPISRDEELPERLVNIVPHHSWLDCQKLSPDGRFIFINYQILDLYDEIYIGNVLKTKAISYPCELSPKWDKIAFPVRLSGTDRDILEVDILDFSIEELHEYTKTNPQKQNCK